MAYPPPSPTYVGPVAHSSGNSNKPITRVVIHCTAGSDAKGSTGTAAYFRDPAATGSAHYIVDPKLTLQSAYDSVVCWHAPPNPHSVGIEMCCSLANAGKGHWQLASHVAMMQRTATLTAELCLAYNIPAVKLTPAQVKAGQKGICGHWDVTQAFHQSSHTDPEKYFPWSQFIGMVQSEIKRITNPPTPPPVTPPKEDDMAISPAQMTELKAYVQLMAVANNNYTRQVLSTATQAILAEINEVDDATATAVAAKLDAQFEHLSDEIMGATPSPADSTPGQPV